MIKTFLVWQLLLSSGHGGGITEQLYGDWDSCERARVRFTVATRTVDGVYYPNMTGVFGSCTQVQKVVIEQPTPNATVNVPQPKVVVINKGKK